jgi:hypothetical protein
MNNQNRELRLTELEYATGGVISGHSEVRIEIFGGVLTLGASSVGGKQSPYMTWTGSDGSTSTSQG